MNRKEAREFIMKCIFQMEGQKDISKEYAEKLLGTEDLGNQKNYSLSVLNNLCEHIEEIDNTLNENSKGWSVTRMAKTDLAIARLAVCEILYVEDIPKAVSINEAVELAKIYGTDQSPKFINAILSKIQ